MSKPPPEGVDRYVPSSRDGGRRPRRSRTRSPPRPRRSPIPRERGVGRRKEGERGQRLANGRPRKTQEELDQEMEDYWSSKAETNGPGADPEGKKEVPPAYTVLSEDIDMIT